MSNTGDFDPITVEDEDRSGQVLAGRYELVERIGAGGTSTIYRAHFMPGDTEWAIKILDPRAPPSLRTRFRHEFRALHQLDHPNVIHAVDYGVEGELAYYTMPLLRGETLVSRVLNEGPLDVLDVLEIGIEVCEAIRAIHAEGLIHRDLAPRNVFIEEDGVRVIDLGFAKLLPDYYARPGRHLTDPMHRLVTDQVMASVSWSAHEVLHGNAQKKSDVFSIGALLYFALAGHPPYATYDRTQRPRPLPGDDLPEGLEATLFATLEKDVGERISLTELQEDLEMFREQVLAERGIADEEGATAAVAAARREKSSPPATVTARRPMWPFGLTAVASAVLASVLTWGLLSTGEDERPHEVVMVESPTCSETAEPTLGPVTEPMDPPLCVPEPGEVLELVPEPQAEVVLAQQSSTTRRSRRAAPSEPDPSPTLAPSLVAARLDATLPQVRRCVAKSVGRDPSGALRVRVVVDHATGSLKQVRLLDELPPIASACVREAVAGAKLPPSQADTRLDHEFTL